MAVLSVATINKYLPLTNKYKYGERKKKRGSDREKEGGRDR